MARTARRDNIEQEKAKAKKVARTLVRLRFSLMADDVLNDMIPTIDDAVDAALASGKPWRFEVEELIQSALDVALPEARS